ncbi:MAG: right-handed parallel beta-helix repeat-containing protein [Phycisphaeraceae bacterium]|nr:right-handed parallel beta-helix repeat-containing protein [Phycisphaeraceae bacterium]
MNHGSRIKSVVVFWLLLFCSSSLGVTYEIHPAITDSQEAFETIANSLKPGDELVLYGGTYSQTARRAVTARGTVDNPIIIRAAQGQEPVLTHPENVADRYNNIEFVDCEYLTIQGIRFKGGSSGVRFIRGHHITFEACEISHTRNNALTMNSGNCDNFIIRRNHIHHTGLSTRGSTEGEGMYIGGHDGSYVTTHSLIEGNIIHHTRSTSVGGNDGIEIKFGSYGNIVRDNVIHDTNIGSQYPGIFVYGGGKGINIVEGNVIWRAGEGIQVVSDAVIRNNIIFNCSATGITAAPHAAVPHVRNVKIVHNTIVNHPKGVVLRWEKATQMIFANNAVYCAGSTAIHAAGMGNNTFSANYVAGRLIGATLDGSAFCQGGTLDKAFALSAEHDYWPRPGSVLIDHADETFAVALDFNHGPRKTPFDVGAYESQLNTPNPSWQIKDGFKTSQ